MKPSEDELNDLLLRVNSFLQFLKMLMDLIIRFNSYSRKEYCSDLRVPGKLYSMLMKPIAQMAVVDALVYAISSNRVTLENAISRVNKINWDFDSDIWSNVLRKGDGRIDNGKASS